MKELGQLTEEAFNTIQEIQITQEKILVEIGNMEYRKSTLLQELHRLQDVLQKILQREEKGLGIPSGTEWKIGPDRKVYTHGAKG